MTEFTIPNYFDANDVNSLVSKLPEDLALIMIGHRNLIIRGLAKTPKDYTPTKIVNLLRKNLWVEYENAFIDKRPIALAALIRNVCTPSEYYELLKDGNHWAWMLRPLTNYQDALEETLSIGLDRLRELVATIDLIDHDKGGTNIPAARLLLSAIKLIDDRLNGQATQKIETKNLNLHSKADELFYKGMDLEIKELEDDRPKQVSTQVLDYLTKAGSGKEKVK